MIPVQLITYLAPYWPQLVHLGGLGSLFVGTLAGKKLMEKLLTLEGSKVKDWALDKSKDWAAEAVKGELQAQVLHRTVKFADRVFHFEKNPALTFLSHYLTDEKLEETGAVVAGAVVADEAIKSFQLGRYKPTSWQALSTTKVAPPPVQKRVASVFLCLSDFPMRRVSACTTKGLPRALGAGVYRQGPSPSA